MPSIPGGCSPRESRTAASSRTTSARGSRRGSPRSRRSRAGSRSRFARASARCRPVSVLILQRHRGPARSLPRGRRAARDARPRPRHRRRPRSSGPPPTAARAPGSAEMLTDADPKRRLPRLAHRAGPAAAKPPRSPVRDAGRRAHLARRAAVRAEAAHRPRLRRHRRDAHDLGVLPRAPPALSAFIIRSAGAADRDDLARLSTQLGYPMTPDEASARLADIGGHPDHALFVAESGDGRLAAWLQVSLPRIFESPRQAEIAGLVVDEDHRGRGIGRAPAGRGRGLGARQGLRGPAGPVERRARARARLLPEGGLRGDQDAARLREVAVRLTLSARRRARCSRVSKSFTSRNPATNPPMWAP